MNYQRMAIEKEAPEEVGSVIRYNLSESAISDQTLDSLGINIPSSTIFTYTEHKGSHKIRWLIANAAKGGLTDDDILVTAGASTSLFIIHSAMLKPKDHIIVARPNYATNLEIPRSIGCEITFIDLDFESRYQLDINRVAAAIRLGATKLISVCSPNNPTGTVLSSSEIQSLASLARVNECYLLVDETYADLNYAFTSTDSELVIGSAAKLGDHVISVSSMSKAYGVPGIRIGWLVTTNKALQETFLAAKELISISGSVVDEFIAEQILLRRTELLSKTIADMTRRREHVASWVDQESEFVDWVEPEAGVMCFIKVKKEPAGGLAAFYQRLLEDHGVYVGRGTWFEQDDTFFRLGYGWPTWEELDTGLKAISKALRG
ncbi:putative aspartate aminotransferase [Trichoderma camerunense]